MKVKMLFVLSLCFVVTCFAQQKRAIPQAEATTASVYYLIRHAEKDRSDKSNKNPDLTEKGKERAAKWAAIFENVPFDAVYSTDYNRTQQTAQPTATAKELSIQSYNPYQLKMTTFLSETKGKTVLIVGHSNTTPAFVNRLIGKETYESIADDNNGNVYIVTITETSKSVQVLTIN
ncbi:MAG: phosphoglycerate mutase family protein [Bacteroidota bacterium]